MSTSRPLTAKQEAFCINYFTMRNATKAAREAGYSPHLLDTWASHLLDNPRIKARLQQLQAKIVPDPDFAVAVVGERLSILSKIARHPIEMPVSAGQKVAAIKEMNLIERIYEAGSIRDVNIVFVIGKGYRDNPAIEE